MPPDPQKPPDTFAIFVRARRGHVVRRFGTPSTIGYRFVPSTKDTPASHEWDTETIFPLTKAEYGAHRKEYELELRPGGGLVRETREAWEKQRADRAGASGAAGTIAEKTAAAPHRRLIAPPRGERITSNTVLSTPAIPAPNIVTPASPAPDAKAAPADAAKGGP